MALIIGVVYCSVSSSELYHNFGMAVAGFLLCDYDLLVNSILKLCDVGDYAHQTIAFGEARQCTHDLLQAVGCQE